MISESGISNKVEQYTRQSNWAWMKDKPMPSLEDYSRYYDDFTNLFRIIKVTIQDSIQRHALTTIEDDDRSTF